MTDSLHQNANDLADDAQRLLTELDREIAGARAVTGECRPPIDVLETATSIEVVVDVPGMAPEALRVAIRRNTVLVVGIKLAHAETTARFHLAERSYGRFARVIRLSGAVNTGQARAVARAGQLRVIMPRIEERRGQITVVPIETA